MLKIESAKILPPPGISGWVQVYGFSPNDIEKSKTKGQLYVIISSQKGGSGVEALTYQREIAGKIQSEYFSSKHEKAFDSLKSATEKIVSEYGTSDTGMQIACCAFAGGAIFSSAFGGTKLYICRNKSIAPILESDVSVITASGFPKFGDFIIVGTKSFFNKIAPQKLKDHLIENNVDQVVAGLVPYLTDYNEGIAGAMLLKFGDSFIATKPLEKIVESNFMPSRPQGTILQPDSKNKIESFIGKIHFKLPKRNIYIKPGIQDEAVSKSRKLTFSVGLILLFVLFVSIGFGIKQKKTNAIQKEYQTLIDASSGEIDQAINLASTDPDESRQLFLDSESKLTQAKTLKINNTKLSDLEKKIEDSRAAVLGEYSVTPDLFLDLGLLSSGFKGDIVSSSGGNIYILDKNGSRIVSIAIDTKKSKVVAGPTVISSPSDIASYQDNVYALLADGIYLVGNTKTKIIDKTWSGDAFIYSFAGNIYVLDKSGNMIYRYSGASGNTYGAQQNWLSASTKVDFSNAFSWGMNGAIYVLYPNSKILKYSLGSPQNFSITGVKPEIGNIDALYADPDNQYIYLLDKAGKRVVVIDKNGKYKAQYIGDDIASATGLVVSEAEKKIILLTGQKLLTVDLKNN